MRGLFGGSWVGAAVGLALAGPGYGITVNLTTAGASGTINGATFTQVGTQPTGSGVIGSFLRVQANGTEQGYNTGGGTPFDSKSGVSLNNGDVSVSDFVSNNACLLLDVNQIHNGTDAQRLISLDALQIYVSPTHNLTTTNLSALGTKVYDMGTGNEVIIDYALAHGSGSGDVDIHLPDTIFANAGSSDAVYVFAHFGNVNASNDGFEEFALLSNCQTYSTPPQGSTPPVPEPAAVALLPVALAGWALRGKLRRR